MSFFDSIRRRIGDLWWYTILLFCVQRLGDVINMFVGLWLVPRYVPMEELGAVLPLTYIVGFIGLPLGIIAVPFMKFLNVYAERGELGKVKALLRDGFLWTGALALLSFVLAYFVLPLVFTRMRVAAGSLGLLIVGLSVLGSISVIFSNAVQGLKMYSTTVWFSAITAPLRLVLMVVFMPFRPLSGYLVGQAAAPGVSVVGAIWVLRKKLGRAVKSVPYWHEDGSAMIRYAIPVLIGSVTSAITIAVDQLVIRHRLSDFDSAGYYMISRFADIGSYFGSVFIVFLFPMVASRMKRDAASLNALKHSIFGTLASGCVTCVLLWIFGDWLLGLQAHWQPYAVFAPHMALLAAVNVVTLTCGCLVTYETAQGRFRYLWYLVPMSLGRSLGLYALLGYGFFEGMLPAAWLRAIVEFNPCRLGFVIVVMFAANIITLALLLFDVYGWRRRQ